MNSTAMAVKSSSLHPKLRVITYVTVSGEERQILSTYGHDRLQLDIDPSVHPAWVGHQAGTLKRKDKVLFGDVNFMEQM
jgi:ribosomal protein L31